jgi:hypothetical protein
MDAIRSEHGSRIAAELYPRMRQDRDHALASDGMRMKKVLHRVLESEFDVNAVLSKSYGCF